MVETNPVDPKLRKSVIQAMSDDASVKLTPVSTNRPGLIEVFEGTVYTHRMKDFEVVGTTMQNGRALMHVVEK